MRIPLRSLVLCYHAISDTWPDRLAVGRRQLERQLTVLARLGYRPAPLDRVLDERRGVFHVTFDDAYRSVAPSLATLERLGTKITVFACTDYADNGRALAVPELAGEARRYPDELATMTWQELANLAERGVEIGSHTVTHPRLTTLTDSELARELRDSKQRIEAELGRPCQFVAYPYGDEDSRVRAAARAAGYAAGLALPGGPGSGDRFAVPRIGVYRRDGTVRFVLKTSSALRRLAGQRRVRPRASASAAEAA